MAATKARAPAKKTAKQTAAQKPIARTALQSEVLLKKPRIFAMPFAKVYPLYVHKAERKGRTKAEVDQILAWLTGYEGAALQRAIDTNIDIETFFARAPRMNSHAARITGVVCGVRVEEVADPLMRKIRYLDKLVDELAKGKNMASILRQ